MNVLFRNKRILVTGACGTVGSVLIKHLLTNNYNSEIIGLDNNESQLFLINEEYSNNDNAQFRLADVRDKDRLCSEMKNIDIVFHTAAFKHVSLCEHSPFEAVQTNILGVQNLISASFENKVKKVIFTSSDKAVNPTSVMGTSKLMGERLMTAANCGKGGNGPVFASTRFGNVLGSSGSVVPVFRQQITSGGPVTLTHPEMTRFIMSIDEAVRLVMETAILAVGGEVFITKMPVIRIKDLARVMIDELAFLHGFPGKEISVKEIGVKPGEKMYEELLSQEETRRTWELEKYFVVFPAFRGMYNNIIYSYPGVVSKSVTTPYRSDSEVHMSAEKIKVFLENNRLLEKRVQANSMQTK